MTTYKSSKGISIDMEVLVGINEKVVAAGNMALNAKGDALGKGGKVIKTAQQRSLEAKKQASVSKVSIKGESKNAEVFSEETGKDQKTKESKPRKKNKWEVELEDGSIIIEEEFKDE
jgi:hypothetical protein